ncbi:MAG TPA: AI-2E family transporter [Stellaceae bacterium]|nr:AI-2E family transporter [Stellaceae bacterium]
MRAPTGKPRARKRAEPTTTARAPVGGWAIAATLAVAAVMLYTIRYALLPFVFAIAIAFVVDPVVDWVERHGHIRRWMAATCVFVLVAGALAAILYWLAVELVSDATVLMRQGNQTATALLTRLFGPDGVTFFGTTYSPHEILASAGRAAEGLLGARAVVDVAGVGLIACFGMFLLLVLVLYFLISGPRLADGAIWLIPPERRQAVEQLLPRIVPALRRYLVGVLAVVVYTSAVAWIGFGVVFGLPHAPLLAVTVGLLEIIPAIGPVTAAVLAAVAAFQHGAGIAGVVGPIAFIIVLRLSIDNLVGPLVLGQAARVHPVVVIFAFVCGAMLFGAIGLLLAVPVAVTIKTVLRHYYAEPIASDQRDIGKPA